MKQLLFSASALLWVLASGCGTKPADVQADGTNNPTLNMNALTKPTTASGVPANSTTAPEIITQANNTSLPAATTTTTTTSAAGLNPAHGQPGHRCDIAVGAPLNSAPPAANSTPSISPKTITTITPVTTPTVKTAPGMNPPHGEPGHRCDIAVGSPLNSAPAKTAASTPTITSTPSVNSNVVPGSIQPTIIQSAPTTTTTAAVKTAPGMNPPHGQAGHRCDIAVGAPLNSKPEPSKVAPVNTEVVKPEQKKEN